MLFHFIECFLLPPSDLISAQLPRCTLTAFYCCFCSEFFLLRSSICLSISLDFIHPKCFLLCSYDLIFRSRSLLELRRSLFKDFRFSRSLCRLYSIYCFYMMKEILFGFLAASACVKTELFPAAASERWSSFRVFSLDCWYRSTSARLLTCVFPRSCAWIWRLSIWVRHRRNQGELWRGRCDSRRVAYPSWGKLIFNINIIFAKPWNQNPWRLESPSCSVEQDQEEESPKSRSSSSQEKRPISVTSLETSKAPSESEMSSNSWRAKEKPVDSDDLVNNYLMHPWLTNTHHIHIHTHSHTALHPSLGKQEYRMAHSLVQLDYRDCHV